MNNIARSSPENHSLAEQAYRLLEKQVVTLGLEPGDLLVENDLIRITGIGRTPVREAVQRLAAEGLLKVLPRKGLMVTTLRRSDLSEMLEARKVLERLLVVKAAERAITDHRQALCNVANHIESVDNRLADLLRLKSHLDELLAIACHNRYLVQALATTQSQCRRLWYMHRNDVDLLQATCLHSALARMVAEANVAGAIRAQDEITVILDGLVTGQDVMN